MQINFEGKTVGEDYFCPLSLTVLRDGTERDILPYAIATASRNKYEASSRIHALYLILHVPGKRTNAKNNGRLKDESINCILIRDVFEFQGRSHAPARSSASITGHQTGLEPHQGSACFVVLPRRIES
jgi:hypothetical protein